MKPGEPTQALAPRSDTARRRLGEVVLEAAVLDDAEREIYLQEIAAADPTLAALARRRLAAAEGLPESFLERPAAQGLDGIGGAEELVAGLPPAATLSPEERYELGETLGEGGARRVVEAYDRQLDRRVALQLLTSEEGSIRELFRREGRAQARVSHPHVLEVYDNGELDGRPFLSMRLVEGGTLGEVAPRLSLEGKIRLLLQVAEGLHAAHRRGLLHRDLEPSSVLVEETPDGDLVAYVTDFGIAAGLVDVGSGGAPARSTAPECLAGAPVDRRSDVYSLGVAMHEILDSPGLPAEVEAIVRRCRAEDPDERYPSARAVAEDLKRFLDGEVVEAYAAGVAYRATRFVLRHRRTAAAAALAMVVMVVASIAVTIFALRADAARERAEHRQGQAEELIRFTVVDLQEKLEPVSRLAVLDDVARAAGEYFAAVPEEELSEDELLRRSRMLYQLGNLRIRQGDLSAAAAPMEESLALTRRLHELAPSDPERLFELGQSWFWVGYVAWERGDVAAARGPMEEYLEISRRLVEIDSENLDWRLELSYAYSNLGSLLQAEGKLEEALAQFGDSLGIKEKLVDAAPENQQWRSDLAASQNTVGVVLLVLGRLREARNHFERELAIREALLDEAPEDLRLRSRIATAHVYLARALARAGELERAEEHAVTGRKILTQLAAYDADNQEIQNRLVWLRIDLGRFAYARDDLAAAEHEWRLARRMVDRSLTSAGDAAQYDWRLAKGVLHYHLALMFSGRGDSGARTEALAGIELLEKLAKERSANSEANRWLGWSYLLAGSLEDSRDAADRFFQSSANVLAPLAVNSRAALVLQPYAEALRCLGRIREADQVDEILDAAEEVRSLDPPLCSTATIS